MNDQKKHWNELHSKGTIDYFSGKASDFADEIIKVIKPSSKILELGCGAGNDSLSLAQNGHTVLATDISRVAINKNLIRFKDIPQLSFKVLDISEPIDFRDNEFDVVYARLSLHYFTDKNTRMIIKELHRVIRPDGYLLFLCKSINDPLHGKGTEIEKNMFENNGHVRHFFSKEYTETLLKDKFLIEKIDEESEKMYRNGSVFIKVIARALK